MFFFISVQSATHLENVEILEKYGKSKVIGKNERKYVLCCAALLCLI